MSESESKLPEANLPEGKPGRHANRLGPKPCLDEFKQNQICSIVGRGLTLQTAADYVGVERRTVYRTALKNAAFGAALREARSRGGTRIMLKLYEAAAELGNVRAMTWMMANCFRGTYYDRGRGIPVDQVRLLFERFSEAMLGEVHGAEDRDRITARLRQISEDFRTAAEANKQLG